MAFSHNQTRSCPAGIPRGKDRAAQTVSRPVLGPVIHRKGHTLATPAQPGGGPPGSLTGGLSDLPGVLLPSPAERTASNRPRPAPITSARGCSAHKSPQFRKRGDLAQPLLT